MTKPRVYLAGAIELQGPERHTVWRKQATRAAAKQGLTTINPVDWDGATAVELTPAEIVGRDRYLLRRCDAILADGRWPVGVGTSMEILDAVQLGKLVVVWGAEHRSVFLRHHTTKFVDTPEEGMEYIADMLRLV